jgi:hypothetical protein
VAHFAPEYPLRVYSNELFRANWSFLEKTPVDEHKNYRFTFNYRLKRREGGFSHMLQQGTCLRSDAQGKPLVVFGTATDISAHKIDSRITLQVEKMESDGTILIFIVFGLIFLSHLHFG